jgi:hypothetical protein
MQAIFLSSDLMFASRVQAAAAQQGATLAVRGLSADLSDASAARLVIADLSAIGNVPLPPLVEGIRQQCPIARLVAYAPHVHVGVIEQAREAGFDEVLTRGQFNERMAALLKEATAAN